MMRIHAALLATALAWAPACRVDPAALPEMEFSLPLESTWPSPARLAPPASGEERVLVTNNLEDSVSIVSLARARNGADDALLTTVPVGFVPVEREGPHHVTVDRAGAFYYVCISNFVPGAGSGPHGEHGSGTADGHLLKLRVDDNVQVASVRIDRNPGDVRLTPDGAYLLASHFDLLKVVEAGQAGITSGPELDARLAVVDPARMERLAMVRACPAAHGLAVLPDARTTVVSCISDEVAIVDLDVAVAAGDAATAARLPLLEEPGTALAPRCSPYAVTAAGELAWVSCLESGELIAVNAQARALDGRSFQLVGRALFGDAREGVIAVAHQSDDGVTFFDTAGPEFLSTRLFSADECVLPHATRFTADGAQLLVVCEGDKATPGTLLVLDAAAPHAIVSRTPLGLFPDDIAILTRAP